MALLATVAMTGCKSKESNYKKAYEKAKAQELAQQQTETEPISVAPVIAPVTTTQEDQAGLPEERLNVLNGGSLKAYNVVCGSFSKPENANNLRNTLVNQGYSAQVAQNSETGMYRVIASSYDDKASAIALRDRLRATYPDAWILYRTY